MTDLLPDCRARETRGRVFSPMGAWIPIFCGNCGCDGGMVPEQSTTFAFYLCNKCAESHGAIAGVMLMPDEVFWARLAQEQQEQFGRFLTDTELAAVVEADVSPLATLVRDRN